MEKRTRYDLTSADTKIIGFEFQYFYFINELLKLEEGQAVGFEGKDDVHIDLLPNNVILIQLKHTIKKNAKGLPVNLTEKDDDLWKTLSNWSKVICDVDSDRNTVDSQISYIENTEFILATNKPISKNKAIKQIFKLNKENITYLEFIKYLSDLQKTTKDVDVKQHIGDVIEMDSKVLGEVMKKVQFVDTGDDLIKDIKLNIQKKMIAANRVNDVFNDLFSELKQDFFESVKKGFHQIITFDEWILNFTGIFERYRQTSLPIRRFKPVFPPNLSEQEFIKELIEIEEIEVDDIVEIANYSEVMLMLQMNLENWHIDGEIANIDIEEFHGTAKSIWRNSHKRAHRSTKKDLKLNYSNALDCIDDLRDKDLKILTTEIGIDLSNGEFYYLSNKKYIGWKYKWKRNY